MREDQLEKYRHDLAYLREMAAQTEKDFGRFGYDFSFHPELPVSFDRYRDELAQALQHWCKADPERIPSLLYHIDLPEHMVPPGYGCKDTSLLSERILQRELIKVILRKHYSG
jgi:hypothetical protein